MSTIGVDLPEDLLKFVEAQVQRGEFANASEYIVALVDAARNTRSEIETALLEGCKAGRPKSGQASRTKLECSL